MKMQPNYRIDGQTVEWGLYSNQGERKYINGDERKRFIEAARQFDLPVYTFCLLLTYTGCRLSETLALTHESLQPVSNIIAIHSLKKRGKSAIREIPLPPDVVHLLMQLKIQQRQSISDTEELLWPWKRTWGWKIIKRVMEKSDIHGLHASPKGLRHGFGVHAVQSGVPLNLVQKWLGHSRISTTAIYTNAVGPEEYAIAQRMWPEVIDFQDHQ